MNNGEFEELISDVKREIKCIEQYRVLTNKFVNENVSQYNINKFKEEQYIENFEKYEDYDYDIYNWIYIKNFKNIVELAENLQQRIDKAIKMLDNYQNNLYSRETRKTLDDDIERTISILQGEEVIDNV